MAEVYLPVLTPEESAQFEAFKAAEHRRMEEFKAAKKAEEERQRHEEEVKAARAAAAKKEEQDAAIHLFKEMLENQLLKNLYGESDAEILRKGKVIREGGVGTIAYPNAFLAYWRDTRYKAKGVQRVNYSMMIDAIPKSQGRDWDGWPSMDEADEEAKKILAVEWRQFINFCRRFADRVEPVA
jgi:hypothetical protein